MVPLPDLVMPKLAPEMAPATVNVLAFTVTVRVAPSVTAPLPRFRSFVPTNVKSLFQDWGLLLLMVMAPLVLLSILALLPPEIVKTLAEEPRAVALLTLSVIALAPGSVSPPAKEL